MKDPVSLIVVISVLMVVGIRLYKKYSRKEKPAGLKSDSKGGLSSSDADDYEPYSRK